MLGAQQHLGMLINNTTIGAFHHDVMGLVITKKEPPITDVQKKGFLDPWMGEFRSLKWRQGHQTLNIAAASFKLTQLPA